MKSYEELYEIAKSRLSEYRFHHSECVAKRCVELAKKYGADEKSAKLVGIVHDIAKEMPEEERLAYCAENGLEIDEVESHSLGLLHGKIGADMAKREFGFSDDLCSAIRCHSTGKANMSLLDKILFVADMSGVDRKFPDSQYIVELGNQDLDECVKYILKKIIQERIDQNKKIHWNTILALNDFME